MKHLDIDMKRGAGILFLTVVSSSLVFASSTSIGFTIKGTANITTEAVKSSNNPALYFIGALAILVGVAVIYKSKIIKKLNSKVMKKNKIVKKINSKKTKQKKATTSKKKSISKKK